MILVDGKKIAQDISTAVTVAVSSMDMKPSMTVIACNPNFETQKYLNLKKEKAHKLGISIEVEILPNDSTTETVIEAINEAVKNSNGVIVQLPLPISIDTDAVLDSIPNSHDIDAFSYRKGKSSVLPPVVGAIDEISRINDLDWFDKRVVIFGKGRLVGEPAFEYAKRQGALVSVVTEETQNVLDITSKADIVVLGVGKPNLLTSEMVKEGVVIFDAGASEDGGLLVGDSSPDVSNKASLFTPVPGGIGPITIALLFRNLLDLVLRQ